MLRVVELFAGYGSQSLSLRDLGIEHKVVGVSEIDIDVIIGYGAMRYNLDDIEIDSSLTLDDMRNELTAKNIGKDFKTGKLRVKNLKKDKLIKLYKYDKAINNLGDVSIIDINKIPDCDYLTYSFPCTDISSSGEQKGIIRGGTRSGLLYECEKIIEVKRPKYLLMENVGNLLSYKFKSHLVDWALYLETLGYESYCGILDSRDYGVAQTRKRVFMVSILNDINTFELPSKIKLTKSLRDFLDDDVDTKYDLPAHIVKRFNQTHLDTGRINIVGTTKPEQRTIGQRDVVYSLNAKTMGCLMASDFIQPKQLMVKGEGEVTFTLENGWYNFSSGTSKNTYKIRRITPKECLRLMGLKDSDIDKMILAGINDNALYKMAGNSIVVDVLNAIHRNMFLTDVDTEGF